MATTWKEALGARIPPELGREIDVFETELQLRRQGKIDERLFAETRLRRGAYGQRYDNGQRHDGVRSRELAFPSGALTKGPQTLWDAPGMQRIKILWGGLTADQMDVLAEVAEEYSDGVLHVTTRQDVQLHFVHIDDTPDLMRRLAAVGITTREACGNAVRNVTACQYAGVCATEVFDVTPYAEACARFLLGHPDTMDFGRKFKIAFSGCRAEACALIRMHDIGAIAAVRDEGASLKRGFELHVGGGLGPIPQQARLFDAFVPEEELLPVTQAVARVFARLGEKKNRARARLKFLVSKLGIDEFRRLVLEERKQLPHDSRWTGFLSDLRAKDDAPLRPPTSLGCDPRPPGFDEWRATNVRAQRQPGYAVATVTLPLGDLTSRQMRGLAELSRRWTGDTVRTTIEQNIAFRWVSEADLPEFYAALAAIGLGEPGAGTVVDVTACPGTATCKLGISSSRGLAAELREQIAAGDLRFEEAAGNLRIKISGCFNSCAQHHLADLGFCGVSRKVGAYTVPHFQVVLGGDARDNGAAFGMAMGAVPSKNVPRVTARLVEAYARDRAEGESFAAFVARVGKARIRALLDDLIRVPSRTDDPSYYSDWSDPREYTIGDMGVGECAGEVVPFVEFGLAASEREIFEAQLCLERGDARGAAELALAAMITAARALVRSVDLDARDDAASVVDAFKVRFCDTGLFADPFVGDKFASYLFRVHGQPLDAVRDELAHRRIEEATLFIEAAHACYARLSQASGGG